MTVRSSVLAVSLSVCATIAPSAPARLAADPNWFCNQEWWGSIFHASCVVAGRIDDDFEVTESWRGNVTVGTHLKSNQVVGLDATSFAQKRDQYVTRYPATSHHIENAAKAIQLDGIFYVSQGTELILLLLETSEPEISDGLTAQEQSGNSRHFQVHPLWELDGYLYEMQKFTIHEFEIIQENPPGPVQAFVPIRARRYWDVNNLSLSPRQLHEFAQTMNETERRLSEAIAIENPTARLEALQVLPSKVDIMGSGAGPVVGNKWGKTYDEIKLKAFRNIVSNASGESAAAEELRSLAQHGVITPSDAAMLSQLGRVAAPAIVYFINVPGEAFPRIHLIEALVAADATNHGPEFTKLLDNENKYWKKLLPQLISGQIEIWSAESRDLTARYSVTYELLRALLSAKDPRCITHVTECSAIWKAIPRKDSTPQPMVILCTEILEKAGNWR